MATEGHYLFAVCTSEAEQNVEHHHHDASDNDLVASLDESIEAIELLAVLSDDSTDNITNGDHTQHPLPSNHRNVPDALICNKVNGLVNSQLPSLPAMAFPDLSSAALPAEPSSQASLWSACSAIVQSWYRSLWL